MPPTNELVIAFDLYGTLVSPKSARKQLIDLLGEEKGNSTADLWRRYQLEYTWRLNSMGLHRPFDRVAESALRHALAESDAGAAVAPGDVASLMSAFAAQEAFDDVPPALRALEEERAGGRARPYVFSNGAERLVRGVVEGDGELRRRRGVWAGYVTASDDTLFKPARGVYEHLLREVGREGRAGELWLVTANPFDVVGARAVGIQVAFVDREGKGWTDRLGALIGGLEPTLIVSGVDRAVEEIMKQA